MLDKPAGLSALEWQFVHLARLSLKGDTASCDRLVRRAERFARRDGDVKLADLLAEVLKSSPCPPSILRERQAAAEARGWDTTGGGDE